MTSETFTVYPTQKHKLPVPPSKIYLHGLDAFNSPIQILNHRFYRVPPSSACNVIKKLRSTLAETLEFYPPITGKVTTCPQGELIIALDKQEGTPFLVHTKDTPYTGDSEDLSPRPGLLLPPDSPILAVKVTVFACGTFAVATSIHHRVTDLRGFLDILELWSKLMRDEPVDLTRIPSDWTRTPSRFFPKPSSRVPDVPPPFHVLSEPRTGPAPYLLVPSVVTRWKITKNDLNNLKRDASPSGSNKDKWISSGDALAALLCGAVTRARNQAGIARVEGRSTEESSVEILAMAADGRSRAPKGDMIGKYLGNFNNLPSVTFPRAELLSTSNVSLSAASLIIRDGLSEQLSPQAIANRIQFYEANSPALIDFSADIILTNWCRFDLGGPEYDIGWGKPFYTSCGAGNTFPPGYSIMTKDHSSGDVSVLLTIEKDAADNLKEDIVLTKYATRISCSE